MQALRKLFFGAASVLSGDRARRTSFTIVLFVVLMLPAFSLPGFAAGPLSHEAGKTLFVLLAVSAAAFFFVAAHRQARTPLLRIQHPALSAAVIILLVSLLSAVLSKAPLVSFFGDFYEPDAFIFTLFAFLLFALVAASFTNARHIVLITSTSIVSFLLVVLIEVARALSTGSLAVVRDAPLVGQPADAIVLSVLVGILSVVMLTLLNARSVSRSVAVLGLVVAIGWGVLIGIPSAPENIPAATHGETMQLAREALKHETSVRALFGSGPRLFFHQWEQYAPFGVATEFEQEGGVERGPSFFTTILVTHGLVGAFAWMVFLAVLAYDGVRRIVFNRGGRRWYVLAMFTPTLFLWTVSFFYYPGVAVLVLAFIFSGLLLGVIGNKGTDASLPRPPRTALSTVMIVIVILAFVVVKDAAAVPLFARGATVYAEGATVEGRALMLWAASLSPRDEYYRKIGQLDYERIKRMLPTTQERAAQFIEGADRGSGKALAYNPADYRNWSLFARVQVLFAQLDVRDDAIERADEAYRGAYLRSPHQPTLYLEHAYLLALFANDLDRAERAAARSLELRPDLAEADQLLADIKRIRQQE